MALKQVEDNYVRQKAEQRRQEMSPKIKGYGEGVIHGWGAAAKAVSDATGGLFTLNEPREITEWRARLKRG